MPVIVDRDGGDVLWYLYHGLLTAGDWLPLPQPSQHELAPDDRTRLFFLKEAET